MKILIINPNSDSNTDEIMRKKAALLALPGVEVEVTHVNNAPKLVSSYEDQVGSAPEMVELVRKTIDRYDAYIVACHSDPNLNLIREISGKPVVGIAEASLKIGASMGNGYAVISPSVKSISKKIALAHQYRCGDLLRTIEVARSESNEDLLAAARKAKETYGVDVIVLGCANYANADGYIERELGIPVLDGIACALILASGLAQYQKYKHLN